jgi:hypothetical protein
MFHQWCFEQGFVGSHNLSHVLMDGGTLSVPFNKINEFNKRYIHAIKNNEKLYIVEQKTSTFNFFMDIDYKDDEALELEQVKSIVKIICDTVETHGGHKCIVSTSLPKPKDGMIKTGIHLNWPGFVVNQRGSIDLMHHTIHILNQIYSAIDWSKVIDSSVYGSLEDGTKGSGFRLSWSHKKGKHEYCKGRGCTGCKKSGKITEGPYLSVFIYQNGSLNYIDQEINLEKLEMSTVRTDNTKFVTIEPSPRTHNNPKKVKKEGGFTKTQIKNEIINRELHTKLERFIQKNLKGQQTAQILNIYDGKNKFFINTRSKYCENIGRNHNSNHIWFHIIDGIIFQKCFCRCNTLDGRKHGLCKDFKGQQHKLPTSLCEILFPKKNLDKIKIAILPTK